MRHVEKCLDAAALWCCAVLDACAVSAVRVCKLGVGVVFRLGIRIHSEHCLLAMPSIFQLSSAMREEERGDNEDGEVKNICTPMRVCMLHPSSSTLLRVAP